jgi:hypothetical protein
MRSVAKLSWFFLAALIPGTASAEIETIRAEDNSLWLAAGASHLDYTEFGDGGDNLDTELGWLPSLSGGFSMLGGQPDSQFPRNLYLAFDFDGAEGDARYNGSLLNGTPYSGSTSESIWTLRGRIGYGMPVNAKTMLIPFAQIGYRSWDREASATQTESYENVEVTGGLMAQFSPTPKAVFSLWGAAGETVSGSLKADNPYLPMHFDLGDKVTWNIGTKAGYWFWSHVELFTRLTYEHLSYGRSQDVATPIPGLFFYEPNSRTDTVTTQFGIAYNFQ